MAYTTINKSSLHFNTVTYTGDGTSPKARTGVGFQPDLVWSKTRGEARNHQLIDSVRGADKTLQSNVSDAEGNQFSYGYLQSFDSDGFTSITGSTATDNWNKNTSTYVAWNWLGANGTASNSNGSITSTVSANTTAGFSIVSYTGTGSAATIGHGLGAVPKMFIVKRRDGADSWYIFNSNLGSNDAYIVLDSTNASSTSNGSTLWNSTAPTNQVFSLGTNGVVNGSGRTYVAYCFAEKTGYSKFGSYTGNGNADGSFIYLGFKPAWVMIKNTSSGSNKSWSIFDTTRQASNPNVNKTLYANRNEPEGRRGDGSTSSTIPAIDMLSNGFKCRVGNDEVNTTNDYIYIAFGQSLVGSNNVPCTAR